jgi:hypothetical protein
MLWIPSNLQADRHTMAQTNSLYRVRPSFVVEKDRILGCKSVSICRMLKSQFGSWNHQGCYQLYS